MLLSHLENILKKFNANKKDNNKTTVGNKDLNNIKVAFVHKIACDHNLACKKGIVPKLEFFQKRSHEE